MDGATEGARQTLLRERAGTRERFTEMDESALNEEVRSFWDEHPCNIRHSDKENGTREYFEDVTRRKYFVESHIPAFARF